MNRTKNVLIADDNRAIVEALSLMLEDAGYTARILPVGASLETIHATIQQNLPCVLLLDIWMSGKDGRAICQYVKNQEATQHLPIIFVSAHNELPRIAQEAGADDYLAKPFRMREIIAKIKKYFGE